MDEDDGLTYITTRIIKLCGYIVGYRALSSERNKNVIELDDPIHVKDLEKYT